MKKLICLILALFMLILNPLASAQAETVPQEPVEPKVKAISAVSMDLATGEIILTKDPAKKMYPASITKLMTALILAENRELTDYLTITEPALAAPAFSINTNLYILYSGDTVTVENCLYAMLLPSANDMSIVAAVDLGGTVENFVKMMNTKGKTLGMNDTNFANPTGLHDENHYSTALDLAKLMKAAYANPALKTILGQSSKDIRTTGQPIGVIEHSAQTLGEDGNVASKTGYTEEAGSSLASVYSRDGRDIVTVVLNSSSNFGSSQPFTDAKTLADESFAMKKTPYILAGDPVEPIEIDYKVFKWFGADKKLSVKSTAFEDIAFYNNTLNAQTTTVDLVPAADLDVFNLKKGAKAADLTVRFHDTEIKSYSIAESSTMDLLFIPNAATYLIALAGALIGLILLVVILLKLLRMRSNTHKKMLAKRQERRRKASRYKKNRDL